MKNGRVVWSWMVVLVASGVGGCDETPGPGKDDDEVPAICSPFAPFDVVGRTWTYTTADGLSGTLVRRVDRVDPTADGALVVTSTLFDVVVGTTRNHIDATAQYRCDALGTHLIGRTLETTQTDADGEVYESTSTYTYSDPETVPRDPGDGFDDHVAYTLEFVGGSPIEEEVDLITTITGPDPIDSPALGTVDAMRWSVSDASDAPLWVVEGIGVVVDGDLELTSYDPGT